MNTLFKRIFIRIRYFTREIGKKIVFRIKKEKIKLKSNTNKVYIFLAADYANMGDVAITYAQKMYINNILPEYELVEIPYKKTVRLIPFLKEKIRRQDIITIVGGGNLTNRYDGLEEARRMVIKTFKKNNIISFPQTVEFTQDILGQESLRRTKKIYSKHKNLTLFARENKSYQFMKENFTKNEVFLVPDIAMFLKEKFKNNNSKRNKIGICLREDMERALKENTRDKIIKICGKENIEYITTHIGDENLIYEKRYDTLYEILKK